jgi:hypothetical protein
VIANLIPANQSINNQIHRVIDDKKNENEQLTIKGMSEQAHDTRQSHIHEENHESVFLQSQESFIHNKKRLSNLCAK